MTYDTDREPSSAQDAKVRLVSLVIGSVEIIVFTLAVHLLLHSQDPLDLDHRAAALAAMPVVALTLPGVVLAWLGRAPKLALALVLAAIPVAGMVWLEA